MAPYNVIIIVQVLIWLINNNIIIALKYIKIQL